MARPTINDQPMMNVNVTLQPEQVATLRSYAKDQGYPSLSAAMRRVISEWVVLKAEKMLRDQHPHLIDTPASYSVD